MDSLPDRVFFAYRRFPTDEEAYYEIKDPVFDIIMEGANDWAENTNWSEPPGD